MIVSVAGEGIAVSIQPAGAGRVLADADQLEQAIMSLAMHACSVTLAGGTLVLETSPAQARSLARGSGALRLTLTYSALEPDVERLFDPGEGPDSGLALAVAHSIVSEQGGVLTARHLPTGTQIELWMPLFEEQPLPEPATQRAAPAILMVDPRERVRAHVHNALEAAGYNLLEAADREEAIALCEVRDGPLDLIIADAEDAHAIVAALELAAQPARLLTLTDSAESSRYEIRQPFTQQALLDRIRDILTEPGALAHGATS